VKSKAKKYFSNPIKAVGWKGKRNAYVKRCSSPRN
jgi:hypothetical protein